MRLEMKYWVDVFGGKLEKMEVELKPFGFRMAPVAQWKTLIADKNTFVEKGKPSIVKVQTITLPSNTFVGPLNIMRHALGCIIDVVECGIPTRVEEEKCINNVIFLPVESGEIKKGDIVGVLKVFYVKTGFLGKTLSIGEPKVEIIKEKVVGNLVWRENGDVHTQKVEVGDLSYGRTHVALWEPIVAEEEVQLKAGEVTRIKIREINVPPNTIVVPIGFTLNAYGSLVDVAEIGKPSRVEESKKITHAIFLPIEDGKVEKGDLLGAISVYFVGLRDYRTIVKGEQKEFTTVYRSGGGVIRKLVKMDPFGFRRKPVARWDLLIADEKKKLQAGKACLVAVKKLKIPRNSVIYPMRIMRNPYGVFIDAVLERVARVEEEKTIGKVIFLPLIDGEINKGDLIGIINIYDVEVSTIEKLRTWVDEWIESQRQILYE
ncbi:MAG: DUF22 domain-containing protein [Archaeoglobaceae archaeon]